VGESALPTASVQLRGASGQEIAEAAVGDGPVHAVFRAIERATGIDVTLVDYQIRALTSGEDAQGQATIVTHYQGQTLRGHAISTDIIEASARAFLEVINRIERQRTRAVNAASEAVTEALEAVHSFACQGKQIA
jgi:2-isopropylmalate synthase